MLAVAASSGAPEGCCAIRNHITVTMPGSNGAKSVAPIRRPAVVQWPTFYYLHRYWSLVIGRLSGAVELPSLLWLFIGNISSGGPFLGNFLGHFFGHGGASEIGP